MKRLFAFMLVISMLVMALTACDEEIDYNSDQSEGSKAASEYVSDSSEDSKAASEYVSDPSEGFVSDNESNETSIFDENSLEDSSDESTPAPEKNIIANPLIFWDTTDYLPDQAYIIGAFNKDGFHTTYEFPYNGRHLEDYIDDDDRYGEAVESSIIDTTKTITFYDRYGSFFDADCGEIKCYGEPIIGEAHVCVDVNADIPMDSQRFLGTYSGVDIFPESIEYSGDSIAVDLDCDGDDEIIRWSFEKDDGVYSDQDYYYYTLEAVINGKTVKISDNKDWVPLEKGDFEVFIADVDMDGNYEVIEYVKVASRFNNIFIYDVTADESEPLHFYTITPEP